MCEVLWLFFVYTEINHLQCLEWSFKTLFFLILLLWKWRKRTILVSWKIKWKKSKVINLESVRLVVLTTWLNFVGVFLDFSSFLWVRFIPSLIVDRYFWAFSGFPRKHFFNISKVNFKTLLFNIQRDELFGHLVP